MEVQNKNSDSDSSKNLFQVYWRTFLSLGGLFACVYYGLAIYKDYPGVSYILLIIAFLTFVVVTWLFLKNKFANSITKKYTDKIKQLEDELSKQSNVPIKKANSKIKIAILLPLHSEDEIVQQDVELILEGFGNTLQKIRNHIDKIEIIYFDHKNNIETAKEIVNEGLDNGIQYFIATMSIVCEKLSKEFPEIIKRKDKKAILLCTVAASPKVVTTRNQVYRFFVNAEEEAKFLVDKLKDDFKTVTMIHFDTVYSKTATKKFNELWNLQGNSHKCDAGVVIKKAEIRNIKNELSIRENVLKLKDKDLIFVVAYCTAYQSIFLALKELGVKSTIVTTSTFAMKKVEDAKQTLLQNFSWVTCYPKKKNDELFYGDAANYFAFASLYRLITVIFHKNYSIEKFDDKWKATDNPDKLVFTPSEDSHIELVLDSTHKKV